LRAIAREKLEIVLSTSVFGRGERNGDSVFALPPAELVNKIGLDFFKYAPLLEKEIAGFSFGKARQPVLGIKLNFFVML